MDASDDPSTISRAKASAMARELNAASARRDGNDNSIHVTAGSTRLSVTRRFTLFRAPIASFEWDLHDLWHTYWVAARHISAEHPALDRLVLQVVGLQKQGVLTRPDESGNGNGREEARTSDGRIWCDLPFLVRDMTAYWHEESPRMSAAQRLSCATFLARLAAFDVVAGDRLCGIGLVILHDALETARPLGQMPAEEDGEDVHRHNEDLSVADLLPAANAWVFELGPKLVALSEHNWNDDAPEIEAPGELFGGSRSAAGFSPERWLFWLRRLEEIARSAVSQAPGLADYAGRMAGNMLFAVDESDLAGIIARAVRESGRTQQVQLLPSR